MNKKPRAKRAPRAEGRTQDDFEARHMVSADPVLHRDKNVSRFMAGLLASVGVATMVLGVVVGATNATASQPVPAAILPLVVAGVIALGLGFVGLGVLFGVVRTVVTDREVLVKYGLWGPRIALDSIQSVTVMDYDLSRFGGFGIRLGIDGTWAYVPGPGKVIEIRYLAGTKEKRVVIGAGDSHETARKIDEARGAAARPRVRVEADETDESDDDEVAEIETAEKAQAGRKRRTPKSP